ncbi:MAG: hypothetical protein CMG09_05070 [Candidatus Marinimicrobia bacterium]|nr:hypothetical protein [Candidatus Neomarinimicrobiota bacterium]|tara:strand:+ start:4723 stop:5502 length:780 start_codon:yes stop_codon:yes gene_type:complete
MKNLVIGDSSQLAQYFCKNSCKIISSRNLPFNDLMKIKWEKIFLCFAEQRTFIENDDEIFCKVNVQYTLEIIKKLVLCSKKIIVYSTAELWNKIDKPTINLSDSFIYDKTPYIESKKKLYDLVKSDSYMSKKVLFMFPVNFNSIYRKPGSLFGKIFDSIKNKKKISIGDTYFYRDLVHPKFVVKKSLEANTDLIIGSGRLTFVNDFIRDLYHFSNMNYEDFVEENNIFSLNTKRNIYYLNSPKVLYSYQELLEDTLKEL